MPKAYVRPTVAVAIVCLLFANSALQRGITALREDPNLHYGPSFDWVEKLGQVDATAVTTVVIGGLIGGFSGLAADILWMKSDEAWHSGRADRMIPILRTVTMLDPHFIDAWRIAGWHWAYNLYVETKDPAIKEQCVQNGIRFLEEGIGWNPDKSDLYFELGWTYFDKLGDYADAAKYYEEARKRKDSPRKPDTILRQIGHAYERIPDIPKALNSYHRVLYEEPGPLLFSVDPKLKEELNRNKLSEGLRQAFQKHGVQLTPISTASLIKFSNLDEGPEVQRSFWLITNRDPNQKYQAKGGFIIKEVGGKLNVHPGDTTGIGATITINLKYVPAWEAYVRGDYAQALKLINAYLVTEPRGAIANHFKARIYEKWGKMQDALKTWEFMAKHNSSDKLAPHRVIALKQQLQVP